MKTKTYDLNLYIIDGHVKILAHQLERNVYNELDEWHCTSVESATRPYSKLPKSYLNSMPVVLDIVVEELPEYDV